MREQESGSRSIKYSPVVSSPRIVGVVGARSLTYQHADHVGQIVDDHWPGAIASPPAGPAAKDWKKWFTQHVVHIIRRNGHFDVTFRYLAVLAGNTQ